MPDIQQRNHAQRFWFPLVVIGLLGLALRVPVLLQQFWLDEIWSYYLVGDAPGAWYIVTELTHSNNHILNSLYMWLLGDQPNWVVYRLLSFVTGIATIFVLGYAGRSVSVPAGYFAAILGACSIPLVVYAGEARGYAPAALFSILSLVLLPGPGDDGGPARLAGFWLAAILGVLAQITFAFVLAGLALGWFARAAIERTNPAMALVRAVKLFLVPGIVALLVTGNIYLNAREESGNQGSAPGAATELLTQALGLDPVLSSTALGAVLVLAVLGTGAAFAREKALPWIMIVAVPVVVLSIIDPPYMFPRYFMVCVPFFLLAAATVLGGLWGTGQVAAKVSAVLLLAVVLAGSAYQYRSLATYGKGDYIRAVAAMYELGADDGFTVGSDHDFRNPMVLQYYTRLFENAGRMSYVGREQLAATPPDFFLLHTFEEDDTPAEAFLLGDETEYTLLGRFPYSGHSGWTWYLYRRTDYVTRQRVE